MIVIAFVMVLVVGMVIGFAFCAWLTLAQQGDRHLERMERGLPFLKTRAEINMWLDREYDRLIRDAKWMLEELLEREQRD